MRPYICLLILANCASAVGNVPYDAVDASDANDIPIVRGIAHIPPIFEDQCIRPDAIYTITFEELFYSSCGPLYSNPIDMQANGVIFVNGATCEMVSVSGCKISNDHCIMQGDDFACSLEGSVTMSANGEYGLGNEQIVCYEEHCVGNYCELMSILGGNQTCMASYSISMVEE
jgi:hypothetical protein